MPRGFSTSPCRTRWTIVVPAGGWRSFIARTAYPDGPRAQGAGIIAALCWIQHVAAPRVPRPVRLRTPQSGRAGLDRAAPRACRATGTSYRPVAAPDVHLTG